MNHIDKVAKVNIEFEKRYAIKLIYFTNTKVVAFVSEKYHTI
jgi:hypothetical protein